MPRDERTISFAVWPHVIRLEGPATTLAAVIEALVQDERLPHDQWALANSSLLGRRLIAQRLRAHGMLVRRIGIAALTRPVSDAIEERVRRSGIKCATMHMPTLGERASANHLAR